jgi:hypothetical protein
MELLDAKTFRAWGKVGLPHGGPDFAKATPGKAQRARKKRRKHCQGIFEF